MWYRYTAVVLAVALLTSSMAVQCLAQRLAPRALPVVDFDRSPVGPYTAAQARRDWPGLQWFGLDKRGAIVAGNGAYQGRSLLVKYPARSVGTGEGGGQFRVNLPPRAEYYLSYMLQFRDGFDFAKGGKLPGLCGGRSNTGGMFANRPGGPVVG